MIISKTAEQIRNIDYHASRLLILIAYCGRPLKTPAIKGRTLLAKLDFFLRYPTYLNQASQIQTGKTVDELLAYELNTVETRMVRYKYGPWDHIYYQVLAYLIAKNLIQIRVKKNVEHFALTAKGKEVVEQLSETNDYQRVIAKAIVLKRLFPNWSGSKLKDFIYTEFPEVVSLPLGEKI